MASFKNLVFVSHPMNPDKAIMAKYRFDNGKELSVVAGEGLYSSSKNGIRKSVTDVKDVATFEILLEGDDDVRGWQTREEIDKIFEANEV
tara:strand:+ start:7337 stop:7606 length:270 start_codon:yes stop_codon:yes gene_type:complete